MPLLFRIAADVVVDLHFAYVAFVVGGQLAIHTKNLSEYSPLPMRERVGGEGFRVLG